MSMESPGTMMTRRSIMLRSSRTFPRQAASCSALSAAVVNFLGGRLYWLEKSTTKYSASIGTSSRCSRKEGVGMGMTFRR